MQQIVSVLETTMLTKCTMWTYVMKKWHGERKYVMKKWHGERKYVMKKWHGERKYVMKKWHGERKFVAWSTSATLWKKETTYPFRLSL